MAIVFLQEKRAFFSHGKNNPFLQGKNVFAEEEDLLSAEKNIVFLQKKTPIIPLNRYPAPFGRRGCARRCAWYPGCLLANVAV